MGLADIKTTEWLLINWGRWAYHNRGLSINWPSLSITEAMAHKRLGEDATPSPLISDSEALVIDKAVAELRVARPAEGEALSRYYLSSKTTYRALGKQMGKHHQVVAELVQGGKLWIEGRIIGKF